MQNIIKLLFFFTLFYTITTEKVKYSLINEAEGWYDEYCPALVSVNITVTVIQDKLAKETISEFNMTLRDDFDDQYRANCKVLPQYEEDEKIPDKDIVIDEAGRIQAQHAFCYFDSPVESVTLEYEVNTLEVPEDAKFEVEVMDNFSISF